MSASVAKQTFPRINSGGGSREVVLPIHHVGSYPKPSCVKIPNWFDGDKGKFSVHAYSEFLNATTKDEIQQMLATGTKEVLEDQTSCGFHVVTNGEIERENYIHHHCRGLNGFDFENAELTKIRNGASQITAPKIVGKVSAGEPLLVETYLQAQAMSSVPVKMTIPGPLTIYDTSNNCFYDDEESLCEDLARAINVEVLRLAEAGCKHIQIDDPLLGRKIPQAKQYGGRCLDLCIQGLPDDVYTTVHICCGYTQVVDQVGYKKAPKHCYVELSPVLDATKINGISIEDAHTRIPDEFFTALKTKDFVLGSVQVCRTNILPPAEIAARIEHIVSLGVAPGRLILAPDCGFAMLSREKCMEKMKNLAEARAIALANLGLRS